MRKYFFLHDQFTGAIGEKEHSQSIIYPAKLSTERKSRIKTPEKVE